MCIPLENLAILAFSRDPDDRAPQTEALARVLNTKPQQEFHRIGFHQDDKETVPFTLLQLPAEENQLLHKLSEIISMPLICAGSAGAFTDLPPCVDDIDLVAYFEIPEGDTSISEVKNKIESAISKFSPDLLLKLKFRAGGSEQLEISDFKGIDHKKLRQIASIKMSRKLTIDKIERVITLHIHLYNSTSINSDVFPMQERHLYAAEGIDDFVHTKHWLQRSFYEYFLFLVDQLDDLSQKGSINTPKAQKRAMQASGLLGLYEIQKILYESIRSGQDSPNAAEPKKILGIANAIKNLDLDKFINKLPKGSASV